MLGTLKAHSNLVSVVRCSVWHTDHWTKSRWFSAIVKTYCQSLWTMLPLGCFLYSSGSGNQRRVAFWRWISQRQGWCPGLWGMQTKGRRALSKSMHQKHTFKRVDHGLQNMAQSKAPTTQSIPNYFQVQSSPGFRACLAALHRHSHLHQWQAAWFRLCE